MVKKTTVNRIRTLSKQGKSANQIQRELRAKGIGLRRKTILAQVRKFKGRPPKPEPYKYIRKKYLTKERRKYIETEVKQKHVAVYGKRKGQSKRYELSGTGKALSRFLIDAVLHPPKKRFERISVEKIKSLSQRAKYIDYSGEWDEKPTIKS